MNRIKGHGACNKTVYCFDCAKIKTLDFNKSPARYREETPRCATAGTEDSPTKTNQAGARPKMKNSSIWSMISVRQIGRSSHPTSKVPPHLLRKESQTAQVTLQQLPQAIDYQIIVDHGWRPWTYTTL